MCSISFFDIGSGFFPISLLLRAIVKAYVKQQLCLVFFGLIIAPLFFNQLGEDIYELPLFRLVL